jgi:hypothetical protein
MIETDQVSQRLGLRVPGVQSARQGLEKDVGQPVEGRILPGLIGEVTPQGNPQRLGQTAGVGGKLDPGVVYVAQRHQKLVQDLFLVGRQLHWFSFSTDSVRNILDF